ncbi:MAG: class I SAM-dependent methyltransferase [Phycisphaerales bacterium]|nr:class I SAM-dependent methyltransferase [Phycisphaerales bacterium]
MTTNDSYNQTADLYDYVVPYASRADVDFFVTLARETCGPVLELGCGTGRVLLPTAQAGTQIVGPDLSTRMLGICRAKLAAESPQVRECATLVEGDMRRFDLDREFALITTPFRSFQHLLTVDDQLACLHCVTRHLAPGGRFVLDVFLPSLERLIDQNRVNEHAFEPEFKMPDGRRVIRCSRVPHFDPLNQVLSVELIHRITHPNGVQERLTHQFQMRCFFRWEAEHLLARAGFTVEAVCGNYQLAPCGAPGANEMIFLARR